MSVEIVPTILTSDNSAYRQIFENYNRFTKRVQVDICDGVFTPTLTIDVSNVWWAEGWAKIDLHMMVMNPSSFLPVILKLQPNLVIFQLLPRRNRPLPLRLAGEGIGG